MRKIVGVKHTTGTSKKRKERRLERNYLAENEVLRKKCATLTLVGKEQEQTIDGLNAYVTYLANLVREHKAAYEGLEDSCHFALTDMQFKLDRKDKELLLVTAKLEAMTKARDELVVFLCEVSETIAKKHITEENPLVKKLTEKLQEVKKETKALKAELAARDNFPER